MTVELDFATEQLLQAEMARGNFRSLDEVIVHAVEALQEKSRGAGAAPIEPTSKPKKRLYELLRESAFADSGLDLERVKDYPRPVDL